MQQCEGAKHDLLIAPQVGQIFTQLHNEVKKRYIY